MQIEIDQLKQKVEELEYKLGEKYKGPKVENPPVRDYKVIVKDSNDPGYVNRLLVATPTTGLVRIEWVQARYGQIVPPNWSMVQMLQYLNAYIPLRYQVDDAQNLVVREFIEKDFEWLLLIEHDVLLPQDAFRRFHHYMLEKQAPVVSGLYYTRSRPSEPLVYRGRGVGFYGNWKFGDLVWCDGVPTGCLLIHRTILEKMWEESEEYIIQHSNGWQDRTRKVFNTPRKEWFDPESNQYNSTQGTSDLDWCSRVMEGRYFQKAGWEEFQDLEYPFLVDTNIFCRHINPNGEQFP